MVKKSVNNMDGIIWCIAIEHSKNQVCDPLGCKGKRTAAKVSRTKDTVTLEFGDTTKEFDHSTTKFIATYDLQMNYTIYLVLLMKIENDTIYHFQFTNLESSEEITLINSIFNLKIPNKSPPTIKQRKFFFLMTKIWYFSSILLSIGITMGFYQYYLYDNMLKYLASTIFYTILFSSFLFLFYGKLKKLNREILFEWIKLVYDSKVEMNIGLLNAKLEKGTENLDKYFRIFGIFIIITFILSSFYL